MPAEANGTGIALPDNSVNPFAAYPMERIPDYCGFGGVNGENSCFPLTPACGQSINTFSSAVKANDSAVAVGYEQVRR